jgi:NADH-quinone oxidoreductase subunit M
MPWMVFVVGFGILVGIGFTWRALTRAFFSDGERSVATHAPQHGELSAVTWPERCGSLLLLAATIAVGLYPQILMKLIVPSLNSPLFAALRNGGWR